MKNVLDNLFFLAGCAAIWHGARLIHPAAGWVVAGFWLIAIGVGGHVQNKAAPTAAARAHKTNQPAP